MERTFCPECMVMRGYDVADRQETYPVRGEDVTVQARVAVCRVCGTDIGIAEMDDAALRAAFAIYRTRHGLLQPEHIREIRSKYGLGQKAFSRLLGWGEVTLARYEGGSLQSDSHDAALRLAENPENVRQLLAKHGERLTEEQRRLVCSRLDELSPQHEGLLLREDSAKYGADASVRKLGEMMVYFAERPKMWRTKLNKMLFYADFLHAKRHGCSISGARYIHMQLGPVPADSYILQAMLVDGTSVDEQLADRGDKTGTVFVACRPVDRSVFSAEELQTMSDVAAHFGSWSASRTVRYSHEEPGWLETSARETIPLSYASSLRLE